MKNIVIAYDGTEYTYKWIKTLMWAKNEFADYGYAIHYVNYKSFFPISNIAHNQINHVDKWEHIDVLLIAYHHSIASLTNNDNLDKIYILKHLRDKCDKLVWLDTADSTGSTQFEVLPYVDYYLKKQLLKDITLYQRHHYGQRIYLDYYHNKYGLDDPNVDIDYTLLDPQYKNKIRVSWNIGIADIWRRARKAIIHPFSIKRPAFTPPDNNRVIDVFFNGTVKYSSLTSFQRKKTCEVLENDTIRKHPSPQMAMSHEEYVESMKKTRLSISPFGWGEVCYRDFETIVYGATLLKPTMDHLVTYPNLYVPYETYIPLDWDLDNYDAIMSKISAPDCREIAENAQNIFKRYTDSKCGKSLFVEHFFKSIS